MELKFRLIAEVIKQYRSNSEERALADYIMELCDIDVPLAQTLTVDELANIVANKITESDDVPLPPRGPGRKKSIA